MNPVIKTSSLLLRPSVLAVCLALSSPLLMHTALAQTSKSSTQTFDIPAGSLDATLTRIARQSGQIISIQPEQVQGRSAPAVQGEMSAEQAYRQALKNSGLELFVTGSGAYNLRSVPTGTTTTLPEVSVLADQETASGPVKGYIAKRSASGTKTDTPVIETPQSISIVGAEQIEVTKAQNLTDVLAYTAGVSRGDFTYGSSDALVIRGFEVFTTYRDGSKSQANYFDGQQEPYGLERVEVLKGASSVLYGTANPGGMVNTVSKRPTTERLRELNVEVGSFDRKQVSGDFAGGLSEDGTWSYRLTGLYRDSDTFIDHLVDDRTYIAPALKWQPNAATSLTFLSDYQKDRTAYVAGLPTSGTVLANVNGSIPRNRFVGEPGFDKYDITRSSLGYLFEHAFNEKLKLRNSLRYFRVESEWHAITASQTFNADQRTVTRSAEDRASLTTTIASDTSLQYDWNIGEVANTSLVGLDYANQKYNSLRYSRTAQPLDLYAPVYGSALGPQVLRTNSTANQTEMLGLYVQNQMKIAEKFVVLLGGRQDWVRYSDRSLFTGLTGANNEKSSAFTGRAGFVYLADNGLAPFVSYSQSFEPVSGRDRFGTRFKPTSGEQYELGVRYQPKNSDTLLSAAIYELTQTDLLGGDPVGVGNNIQIGEVRSKGLELEAKTKIGRNANLIAAYAYTDAKTIRSSPLTPQNVGRRVGGVPENQFSIWGDYSFGSFGIPGLKIGAGVRFVDTTTSDFHDIKTPAYTLLDAMASYGFGSWKFSLNATNLADKTYASVCPFRCFYGEPRKVIATASYRW